MKIFEIIKCLEDKNYIRYIEFYTYFRNIAKKIKAHLNRDISFYETLLNRFYVI